jgi:hypothetical protein
MGATHNELATFFYLQALLRFPLYYGSHSLLSDSPRVLEAQVSYAPHVTR